MNIDFKSPFRMFLMHLNAVLSRKKKLRRFMAGQEYFFLKLFLKVHLHTEVYSQCMFSAENYEEITGKIFPPKKRTQ